MSTHTKQENRIKRNVKDIVVTCRKHESAEREGLTLNGLIFPLFFSWHDTVCLLCWCFLLFYLGALGGGEGWTLCIRLCRPTYRPIGMLYRAPATPLSFPFLWEFVEKKTLARIVLRINSKPLSFGCCYKVIALAAWIDILFRLSDDWMPVMCRVCVWRRGGNSFDAPSFSNGILSRTILSLPRSTTE